MKKKYVLWLLLDLVFLIVFNTVFFMASGFKHQPSVWLSYGFIHFAYMMLLITPLLVRKSSAAAVFGFSVYYVSMVYFLVEFVVGVIFILLKLENYKIPLLLQIIIAGIYTVLLLIILLANISTADSIKKHEEEVFYIKTYASHLENLIGKLDNKEANKEIEKLYDLLHSSPMKTISSVHFLETEIKNKISELESAVAVKNNDIVISLTHELSDIINERNRKIKLNQ